MPDNFRKMKPEGIAMPDLSKVEKKAKKEAKKEADALEKSLDRAARKLQDGRSSVRTDRHNNPR